jgi:hypothetical protein
MVGVTGQCICASSSPSFGGLGMQNEGFGVLAKISVCVSRSTFSIIPPHLDENVHQVWRPAAVRTSTNDSDGDHNIATGAFSFRAATAPSR